MTTSKRSAGLLLFRHTEDGLEVLLGHMGGPFFAKKDDGAWSIPKGELSADEAPADAARREFVEETVGVPHVYSTLLATTDERRHAIEHQHHTPITATRQPGLEATDEAPQLETSTD